MHTHSLAEMLEALAKAQTAEQQAHQSIEIAKLLADEGDQPQALRYATQALALALPAQKGEAQYQVARMLFIDGELEAVKQAITQALAYFQAENQLAEVGKCYNMFGAFYTNTQEFALALSNFELAIQHNEASNNVTQLGKVLAHLAIFVRLAMPEKNIPLFYQNLLADAPPTRTAFVHYNLGKYYRYLHQNKQALEAFEMALALKQDHNIKYGLAETSYQLASLHDLNGNTEISYHFHLAALGQFLDEEEKKTAQIELILYYLEQSLADIEDESIKQHTLKLLAQATEMGFKSPTEHTDEQQEESTVLPEYKHEESTDLDFASRLKEVAQFEREMSAEELEKQYAQNKDIEIGLMWLKKRLNQYNNAWTGRKAKLKMYEDAKFMLLKDIDDQLAHQDIDSEEHKKLSAIKKELA